jgi:hypothetical protein
MLVDIKTLRKAYNKASQCSVRMMFSLIGLGSKMGCRSVQCGESEMLFGILCISDMSDMSNTWERFSYSSSF